MSDHIERWRTTIHRVRQDLGILPAAYPDDVILALIEIESSGDEYARGQNPQFCGLLQMGSGAGIDTGMPDRGVRTTEALLGDGRQALHRFFLYQERYKARHEFDPDRIALIWKGGPGTTKTTNDLTRAGMALDEAIEQAAQSLGVPNVLKYVNRFRRARDRWLDCSCPK